MPYCGFADNFRVLLKVECCVQGKIMWVRWIELRAMIRTLCGRIGGNTGTYNSDELYEDTKVMKRRR